MKSENLVQIQADFDEDEPLDLDEFDENGFYRNCGMLRDGTCLLAGSEECDWECGGLDED